jgi:hypothetical protein
MRKTVPVLLVIVIAILSTVAGIKQEGLSPVDLWRNSVNATHRADSGYTTSFHRQLTIQEDFSRLFFQRSRPDPRGLLDYRLEKNPQPTWLREFESKDQSRSVMRSLYKSRFGNSSNQKLIKPQTQQIFITSMACSKNLQENSPEGYFLLI